MGRCIWCGNEFHYASKPRWAFNEDFVLEGKVHSGCGAKWAKEHGLEYYRATSPEGQPLERSRRYAWVGKIESWDARFLFAKADTRREEMLRHWQTGGRGYTDQQIQQVRDDLLETENLYSARFPVALED